MAFFYAFSSFENYINKSIEIILGNVYRRLPLSYVTKISDLYYIENKEKNRNNLIEGRLKFLLKITGIDDIRKSNCLEHKEMKIDIEKAYNVITESVVERNNVAHGKETLNNVEFNDLVFSMLNIISYIETGDSLEQYFKFLV